MVDTTEEPLEIDCAAASASTFSAGCYSSVSIGVVGACPVVKILCTKSANCGSVGDGTDLPWIVLPSGRPAIVASECLTVAKGLIVEPK
eukprot:4673381-Amphidinium_carterae.1